MSRTIPPCGRIHWGLVCPNGTPTQTTADGAIGYISTKEQLNLGPCSGYLDVYESDGTTVIGRFPVGMDNGTPYAYATENGTAVPACINPSHAK